jgi:hypothetical protein
MLFFAVKYDDATYGEGAYFTALEPPPANTIEELELNNYGQDSQIAGNFLVILYWEIIITSWQCLLLQPFLVRP